MVCPSCNKFPSFEIGDPESDSLDAENGIVTGTVRLVLTTACCGDEAKEANFDVELDLQDALTDALKEAGVENPDLEAEGVEFDVTSEDVSGDDRYEDKDRRGKQIKNSRYMKHFYCVDLNVTVACKYPNGDKDPISVTVDGTWHDEIQASAMDELC